MPHYKTRQEISQELGISISTLRREMKEKGIFPPPRKPLHPRWQKAIYLLILWPDSVAREDYENVKSVDIDDKDDYILDS
jgi:hypothetical protein